MVADKKKKRVDDEDDIDPDAAPPPQEFKAPKGLGKIKPDAGPIDVKSGSTSGTPPPLEPGSPTPAGGAPTPKPRPAPAKREEIDPDAAPPPKEFEAPKGLLKMRPEAADFTVKSGAGAPPMVPPPPPPPGAAVKMDRPVGGPKPHVPTPDEMGEVDVRFQKPEGGRKPHIPTPEEMGEVDVRQHKAESGPKPHIPTPEEMGEVDVRMHKAEGGPKPRMPHPEDLGTPEIQQQKGAPKLPKIEAPGEFDVVKPHASPEPKPQEIKLPTPLEGDVEIKDYRRTGPVDVSGQAPDPFGLRKKVGVVDTTFARYNMGDAAEDELKKLGGELDVIRRTVPGIKDLAVECKILFEKHGCDLILACGMVGKMPVDKTCAHEASLAIQWTQLAVNKHILEVFVHEDEAKEEKQLAWLMDQRTREHAVNAWNLVFDPEALRAQAGTGQRQGFADAGAIPLP